MSGPRFSVVVPAYNGERFISRTIDSLLAQSYPAHEIIVIDDGSTDSTPAILDRFGSRIRRKRVPNAGVSAARNEGMALSTGDWLSFVDQDDILFKRTFARMAEAIARFPGIGVFCSDHYVRYEYLGRRLRRHFSVLRNKTQLNFDAPLERNAFGVLVNEHFIGVPASVVIKKSVALETGPWNSRFRYAQDLDFWLRAATRSNFVILKEALCYKRTHESNVSKELIPTWEDSRAVLEAIRAQEGDYIRRHGLESVMKDALVRSEYDLGALCFAGRDARAGYAHYRKALALDPSPANALRFAYLILKKTAKITLRRF